MTRIMHAAGAAALAAVLLSVPLAGRAQDTAADPAKIEALEAAVRTLTTETGAQRGELEALRVQLAERDSAAAGAARDLAARDAKIAALTAQLGKATADLAATAEAQRALSEEAETVAANAAAIQLRLTEAEAALAERNAVLERQRADLLAARNDLASAEARLAGKDKEVAALAAAGRELVAAGDEASRALADRDAQLAALRGELDKMHGEAAAILAERDATLAEMRSQLLATRNDLASAEARLVGRDKEVAALAAAGRELVAANEALTGPQDTFMVSLAQAVGPDSGVRMIDDRFIFPSDVAFVSGSARLTPAAREKALALGREIAAATAALPPDGDWLLRVDGHTDRQRVGGRLFASNRDLSAARALEVVEVLTEAGVPPERLAPAAFGEFRPLDPADTAEAYQANRRIELRLDDH